MSAPCEADPAQEVFEICDEAGTVIGTAPRSKAHQLGLLHKAVYVFVFDRRGRLLIQQRSAQKKIGPNQWDLSVAEHLAPGESFHQAAQRGLQEELGIEAATAAGLPAAPLGPVHQRSLVVPGLYVDNELVQSFRLDDFEGQVAYNPAEVQDVKFVELPDLRAQMAAEPDSFTQWFREEAALLQFFGDPALN